MNLFELTVKAANDIDTYRHPNLDDWVAAIDPVLRAAGKPGITTDLVNVIKINKYDVVIHTRYSVRMCTQSDETHIPIFILEATDPIFKANEYRISAAIIKASDQLRKAQNTINSTTAEIEALTAELKALHKSEFSL